MLIALACCFLGLGFWWNHNETSHSDRDRAQMEAALEDAARNISRGEARDALGAAQLGDYRKLDHLVPRKGQVRADLRPDGVDVFYETNRHRPNHCFVLRLNTTSASEVHRSSRC